MGCDIHCYVEYKEPNYTRWLPFGGQINPGRSYRTFAHMADVRNGYDNIKPISPPRGLPPNLGYQADGDNWLYVADNPSPECVSRETALRYVQYGSKFKDSSEKYVSHPDWHSHSWLTSEELAQCLEFAPVAYYAILAAMKELERQGCQSRLVFWFDN